MKVLGIAAIVGFLALSTSGCSVNPATGEQSFTGLMSSDQELRVGRSEHPKILQQFGGAYTKDQMETYVNDLGQRLALVSEMPDLKWTFTVLDHPTVNAFALPGGFIYISRGLVALAENEAELAAVLGHEIGHVTARHTAQRYSRSVLTGLGATVLGAVVGGAAGDLANVAGQAYVSSFSRTQEMEADALGIRYMTKLGYDPKAASTFFEKLAKHTELEARMRGKQGQQGHYSIFASHPDTQSRVQATRRIAQSFPPDLNKTNRANFLERIQGLEYGASIRQGVIEDRDFRHPDLRLAFSVPQGFVYTNKPSYVAATHDNGAAIIFQMTGTERIGRLSMTRYIQEIWASDYTLRNVQSLTINGMEAATGEVRLRTRSGERDIRYIAILDGNDIFQFRYLTPPNLTQALSRDLRTSTYSFRRLSEHEARNIRGKEIRLHTVQRGETLASLSQKIKQPKLQKDWLRTLNALALQDGLQAGETVKLIR